MSTTSDIRVAIEYALSRNSLLFKVVADSFMCRGADITFLSAFPAEHEFVYPPLVSLQGLEPSSSTRWHLADIRPPFASLVR